jgi:hypothetical protein
MKRLRIAIPILIILAMSLYAWQGVTWYAHDIIGAALPIGCDVIFYGAETQQVLISRWGYGGA